MGTNQIRCCVCKNQDKFWKSYQYENWSKYVKTDTEFSDSLLSDVEKFLQIVGDSTNI